MTSSQEFIYLPGGPLFLSDNISIIVVQDFVVEDNEVFFIRFFQTAVSKFLILDQTNINATILNADSEFTPYIYDIY